MLPLPGRVAPKVGPKVAALVFDPEEDPRGIHRDEAGGAAKSKAKAIHGPPAKKASGKGAGKGKGKSKPAEAKGKAGAKAAAPLLVPVPLPPPPAPAPEFDFAPPVAKSSGAAPAERAPRDYKPAIGGGEASYAEHPDPDTLALYKNWRFRCPHHDGCERTRGLAPRNMRPHGRLQPIAYLHAWRDTPPGPNGHRLTNPTAAAVADFFNANETALANLAAEFPSS